MAMTIDKHHIVPKHDGGLYHPAGSNDPSNLIFLTRPEHTEAHRLLKEQTACLKCKYAWLMMSNMTEEGELVRRELAHTRMMGNKNTLGRKLPPETCSRMSKAQLGNKKALGYKHSAETCAKMSKVKIGNKHCLGRKYSPESLAKMSMARIQYWKHKKDQTTYENI
jgi:hypothetical protein